MPLLCLLLQRLAEAKRRLRCWVSGPRACLLVAAGLARTAAPTPLVSLAFWTRALGLRRNPPIGHAKSPGRWARGRAGGPLGPVPFPCPTACCDGAQAWNSRWWCRLGVWGGQPGPGSTSPPSPGDGRNPTHGTNLPPGCQPLLLGKVPCSGPRARLCRWELRSSVTRVSHSEGDAWH